MAGNNLSGVGDRAHPVTDRGDGGIEIELPAVGGGGLVTGEGETEVAERLVLLLAQRLAHEFPSGKRLRRPLLGRGLAFQGLRLGILARRRRRERTGERLPPSLEQFADLGQALHRSLMLVLVRLAGPDRDFVELDQFGRRAAEDHRPQAAVADRQGIRPFLGRAIVPQNSFTGRQATGDHGDHR